MKIFKLMKKQNTGTRGPKFAYSVFDPETGKQIGTTSEQSGDWVACIVNAVSNGKGGYLYALTHWTGQVKLIGSRIPVLEQKNIFGVAVIDDALPARAPQFMAAQLFEYMRDRRAGLKFCSCVGSCRGRAGLSTRYVCSVDQLPGLTPPSEPISDDDGSEWRAAMTDINAPVETSSLTDAIPDPDTPPADSQTPMIDALKHARGAGVPIDGTSFIAGWNAARDYCGRLLDAADGVSDADAERISDEIFPNRKFQKH